MRTTILLPTIFACLLAPACVLVEEDPYYYEEYEGDSSFEDAFAWGTITIDNRSIYDIDEVRVSPSSSSTWGDNELDFVLEPGDAIGIDGLAADTYDILIVDEGGLDCMIPSADLRFEQDVEYLITTSFLEDCE